MNTDRNINPFEWDYQAWRKFFRASALWNLSGAIPSILFPALNMSLFYGVETTDYYTLFLNRGLWFAILFFGVGYAIISTDPAKHWGIIVMGIIGKVTIAVMWFYLVFTCKATAAAFFAAFGDSCFTVLFVVYLVMGPRSAEDSG